jgi:OmcA/MtrC family decaheme c-type cytochrome
VVCHNPNATDTARRPAGVTADGKLEESIDFKTLIHGIHAGSMRTNALVVYGFGGSVNDFSGVGFPGQFADCSTCHVGNSYTLTGVWATPTASGIAGTTVTTGGAAAAASSYLRMSPTAAVCSSCHDSTLAKLHMADSRSGGSFSATAAQLGTTVEVCTSCHGPGQIADVKTMHGVK